jgi:hypothetical protein
MDLPDSFSYPCNAMEAEVHPTEPYHVAHNAYRFSFGKFVLLLLLAVSVIFSQVFYNRFEERFLSGYQHDGFPMQAAPTIDISFEQGILIDERLVVRRSVGESHASCLPVSP